MIQLSDKPVIVQGNTLMEQEEAAARGIDCAAARQNTLAWNILAAHNTAAGDDPTLRLRFDALASHDITYVGIIQTARASGLERFPMPYALTNCHNSLCAVGGTINEDDHLFGLTAARKYGGIFVPPHLAVIHQYAREMMAGCGKMILGSDSHTRYGALGTMSSSCWARPMTWPVPKWFWSGWRTLPVPAWARRTSPSPLSARCSRTASSRTGSWNSPVPAWRAFPWNTAAVSTS